MHSYDFFLVDPDNRRALIGTVRFADDATATAKATELAAVNVAGDVDIWEGERLVTRIARRSS
jgi:hypothetical protein